MMPVSTVCRSCLRRSARIPALLLVAPAAPLHAQELLQNNSFESPVAPLTGNNFYTTIPNWTVANLTPVVSQPYNIVRPSTGYTGGPATTPSGGGSQYLDINSAGGDLIQTFTAPGDGIVTISGYFSVRDFAQAISSTLITLKDNTGATVGTAGTTFAASDPLGTWKQAKTMFLPVKSGVTYKFDAYIDNYINMDIASVYFYPAISVSKTVVPFSDPIEGTTNPKFIPGGFTTDTWTVTEPSTYTSTAMVLTMATPPNSELVVSDYGGAGSGPAAFGPGSSGLTYAFTSLAGNTDSIDFSNNNASTWTYAPTIGSNGSDPAVTNVRVRPSGSVAPGSTFTVALHFRIK